MAVGWGVATKLKTTDDYCGGRGNKRRTPSATNHAYERSQHERDYFFDAHDRVRSHFFSKSSSSSAINSHSTAHVVPRRLVLLITFVSPPFLFCVFSKRTESRPVTSCPLRPSPFVLGRRTMDYRIPGCSWSDTPDPVPSCPLRPSSFVLGRKTMDYRIQGCSWSDTRDPVPSCPLRPSPFVLGRKTMDYRIQGRSWSDTPDPVPSCPLRPSSFVLGRKTMDYQIHGRSWSEPPDPVPSHATLPLGYEDDGPPN